MIQFKIVTLAIKMAAVKQDDTLKNYKVDLDILGNYYNALLNDYTKRIEGKKIDTDTKVLYSPDVNIENAITRIKDILYSLRDETHIAADINLVVGDHVCISWSSGVPYDNCYYQVRSMDASKTVIEIANVSPQIVNILTFTRVSSSPTWSSDKTDSLRVHKVNMPAVIRNRSL